MKIKIENKNQLQEIIYTWIQQYNNCVIKLYEQNCDDFFYFTSAKINNKSLLLNMCAGNISVGDVIDIDGKLIMGWIKEKCEYIDFKYANLTAYLEDSTSKSNLNFRQVYLKDYSDIKKTTPILLMEFEDAMELFERFLNNDECTKIVYAFSIDIPDLNHTFKIDLMVDKIYVYGKTLISFSKTRPDVKGLFPSSTTIMYNGDISNDIPGNVDSMHVYFPKDEENLAYLCDAFTDNILTILTRVMNVSKEKVNIYAYSNCELI